MPRFLLIIEVDGEFIDEEDMYEKITEEYCVSQDQIIIKEVE